MDREQITNKGFDNDKIEQFVKQFELSQITGRSLHMFKNNNEQFQQFQSKTNLTQLFGIWMEIEQGLSQLEPGQPGHGPSSQAYY